MMWWLSRGLRGRCMASKVQGGGTGWHRPMPPTVEHPSTHSSPTATGLATATLPHKACHYQCLKLVQTQSTDLPHRLQTADKCARLHPSAHMSSSTGGHLAVKAGWRSRLCTGEVRESGSWSLLLYRRSVAQQRGYCSVGGAGTSVEETVTEWTQRLEEAEVPEASLSAQHIVAHVLGLSRAELTRHGGMRLGEGQRGEVLRLMTCRLARMPVQYLVGHWDFHNITLSLQPPVFIPRQETEALVELCLDCLEEAWPARLLELGCGSGAISLAILHARPNVECVAVDQSRHAVELTRKNGAKLGVGDRLQVVQGKVVWQEHHHHPLLPLPHQQYDLVVSNPPYVLRKDLMNVQPEIMMYEDLRALDGGKDGLQVVRGVVQLASHVLPPGNPLIMEMDPCHSYLLPAWLQTQPHLCLQPSQVFQDFSGKDRFIKLVKQTPS